MFTIQRNHLSDPGVDYVTFGKGDKTLIIITGLSLQRLGDMSNLTIYSLFYRYAKEYTVYIFDRKDHIEEGITIENMADDLYHSLEVLHIANASIIGISGRYDCSAICYQVSSKGEEASISSDTFSQ